MPYALGAVEVSVLPYLITILTALAFCVVVLAGAALLDSDRDWALVRAALRVRLSRTRLRRMLQRRGIAIGLYARLFTPAQLREQMNSCDGCRLPDLCDRALASRTVSHASFAFCPNRPALERYRTATERVRRR